MVSIASRKSKVVLCSMKDISEEGGVMRLFRKGVLSAWAEIKNSKPSRFSHEGYVVEERSDKVSHIITMKYRHDIDITDSAWIYHERLKSPPRWFRIISVSEDGIDFVFSVRLYENSFEASPPIDVNETSFLSPIGLNGVDL